MFFNKGPIDETVGTLKLLLLHQRKKNKGIKHGTHPPLLLLKKGSCFLRLWSFDDLQPIFDLIKAGEYGSTEIELYRVLTHGLPGTVFRRWDYLPRDVRWQMVHYIRSEMSKPQIATADDWEVLKEEGI